VIVFIVDTAIRLLFRLIARVRPTGLSRIPERGPLIVVTNHINFLEIPLLRFLFKPRQLRGITKAETWNRTASRILANLWGAIPIRRGAVDRRAFARALAELEKGGFIGIAPEGTRSHHGRLGRSNAGVVILAARSGAPVLPVAHWGGEQVFDRLRRLRRTILRVRVGEPIHVPPDAADSRASRERELGRIMSSLAALLPPHYRGAYA
jgi:1-acyl-sn-glycerol-3-phosphate acyltransferase